MERNLFEEIQQLTKDATERDMFQRFCSLVEEVGELAGCLNVESGNKDKVLKETSKEESVDCVITALSMYYYQGGANEEMIEIMSRKLDKWKTNQNKMRNKA